MWFRMRCWGLRITIRITSSGWRGKETICAAHIAAAVYGIENNLGCLVTPLRACFNYAEDAISERMFRMFTYRS